MYENTRFGLEYRRPKVMNSRELVETALHVLTAWTQGRKPASTDVKTLRGEFPASAGLPVDELACQVIRDLAGRAFPKSEQPGMHGTALEEWPASALARGKPMASAGE
jgi:hypothetical protein